MSVNSISYARGYMPCLNQCNQIKVKDMDRDIDKDIDKDLDFDRDLDLDMDLDRDLDLDLDLDLDKPSFNMVA